MWLLPQTSKNGRQIQIRINKIHDAINFLTVDNCELLCIIYPLAPKYNLGYFKFLLNCTIIISVQQLHPEQAMFNKLLFSLISPSHMIFMVNMQLFTLSFVTII